VLVILEINIDNFLSKQELTMYVCLYWRRLLNDKNIDVKKIALHINKIIICFILKFCAYFNSGDRGGTVVKVLCYKSEGRWFDPDWCYWNFSLT